MNWGRGFACVVAGFSLMGATVEADAATIAGAEALASWNLIVFGNAESSGRTEGRAFVGGDLTSDGARFEGRTDDMSGGGGKTPKSAAEAGDQEAAYAVKAKAEEGKTGSDPRASTALTVVGDANVKDGRIDQGGAAIGGNLAGMFDLTGKDQQVEVGGRATDAKGVTDGLGKDFTATLAREGALLKETLTAFGSDLAKLDATARADAEKGRLTLVANEGLTIFNLALSDLESFDEISLVDAKGGTTLVNVSGEVGRIGAKFASGASDLGSKLIWNFYEAKKLDFDEDFLGTVLAGDADVTLAGALRGTLVASQLSQSGDIQYASFQGDLSAPGSSVSATPEPASWVMLLIGFGAVGFAARRRRAAMPAMPARAGQA